MAAFIATTALLSLAAVANAQSSNVTGSTSACPEYGGVHFIVARASTEAPGFGIIGAVKNAVVAEVPGSTAEAVDYPATLSDYFNSESAGVDAMKELVQSYTARCSAPLVLLGYSQGAQVTMDTLVGQMDAAFAANDTIDDSESVHVLDQVAAAVVMGDPSFNTTESAFHVGNATIHGLFPRQNVDLFMQTDLASRVRSYCDAGDPYCAGGNFSQVIIHLTYLNRYQTDAVNFILGEIKDWYAAHPDYNSTEPSACSTSSALTPSRPTATPYGTGVSPSAGGNATKTGGSLGTPGVLPPTNRPTASVTPSTGGAAALKGSLATGALLAGVFAFLL